METYQLLDHLTQALRQLIITEWDLAVVGANERTVTSHLSRIVHELVEQTVHLALVCRKVGELERDQLPITESKVQATGRSTGQLAQEAGVERRLKDCPGLG